MRQGNHPEHPGETTTGQQALVFHEGHRLTLILEPDGRLRRVLDSAGIDGIEHFSFGGRTIVEVSRSFVDGELRAAEWEERLERLHTEKRPIRYATAVPGSSPGQPETVECIVTPVVAADGTVESLVLDGEDHAPARLVEQQLRDREHAAREQQEQLRVALAVTGLGRYVVYLREDRVAGDDRLTEIFGVDVDELTGRAGLEGLLALVHPSDLTRVREAMADATTGRYDYDIEYRVRRPTSDDGAPELRWVAGRGRVEFDTDGPFRMIGVVEDITERRNEEAAQLRWQKREAIGTLAGGIAHDFNNVISAILSNAALAEKELELGLSPTVSLTEITRGAERAAEVVQRLLAFSREDEVEPSREPFDLGGLVQEACALVGPGLPSAATLDCTVADDLPSVVGIAADLHRVMVNLITNAGQAIDGSAGTVRVRVDRVRPSPGTGGAPEVVRVTVEDSGPGIPESVMPRIFEPFFTTKPAGKGTGLGLAAAQTIVRDHGGLIEADASTDLGGARFRFALPAGHGRPGGPGTRGTTGRSGPLDPSAACVLYVDDEAPLVRLAERALPAFGHSVLAFEDPRDALAAVVADPSSVDALITDLSMPAMSGLDLIAAIREVRPDLPVILSSGFLTAGDLEAAEALRVDVVVPKPCSIDDLATALGRALARR